MDRQELADFLRSRRERITPQEAGLPAGLRRRTPGLRREEVAQLAFISTEYYTRMEQARGPHPSDEVLNALSRALRLSDQERAHLHHLAGLPLRPPAGPVREVRPSILELIHRLPQAAAIVLSASYEAVAWNDLAVALLGDFAACTRRERNFAVRAFLHPGGEDLGTRLVNAAEAAAFQRTVAHDLRAAAARYPEDPELRDLIRDLRAGSPEFERLWSTHDVQTRQDPYAQPGADESMLVKTIRTPRSGILTLNCDVLDIADRDQRVIIYTADPGSAAQQTLRALDAERVSGPPVTSRA